jgi:hypothetical protein
MESGMATIHIEVGHFLIVTSKFQLLTAGKCRTLSSAGQLRSCSFTL